MLLRDTEWEQVREQFTEDEKKALRAHVTGETICPAGIVVEADGWTTGEKLKAAIAELRGPTPQPPPVKSSAVKP